MYGNIKIEAKDFIQYKNRTDVRDVILCIFYLDILDYGDIVVDEFQLNLAGNIMNFKDKGYDERKTKTNID